MIALLPLLAQATPEGLPDEQIQQAQQMMTMSTGQLVLTTLASIGVQVIFGFWAKSRAEDHGVNPWLAFAAGFLLGPIGPLIVPILKKNAVFFTPKPQPLGPLPAAKAVAGAPAIAPVTAPAAVAAAIVVGSDGYFACPACGARVKAGRRSCMGCGVPLPKT